MLPAPALPPTPPPPPPPALPAADVAEGGESGGSGWLIVVVLLPAVPDVLVASPRIESGELGADSMVASGARAASWLANCDGG